MIKNADDFEMITRGYYYFLPMIIYAFVVVFCFFLYSLFAYYEIISDIIVSDFPNEMFNSTRGSPSLTSLHYLEIKE